MCGSSAGEINFPDYMETFHQQIIDDATTDTLDFSVTDFANTAWGAGGSPYEGEEAYDPSTEIASSQARLDTYEEQVGDLDPTTDWQGYVDDVLTKVDDVVFSETDIDNAVSAFEDSAERRQLKAVNRLTGGLMDVNAVQTSAFVIGMALLESEMTVEIAQFEQALRLENLRRRYTFLGQGVATMMEALRGKIAFGSDSAKLQAELNRVSIVARSDESERNLSIDIKDALWDFEIMGYVQSALASIHGAPSRLTPPEPGAVRSGLSGALAGASVGTAAAPGVGTAIGAGAGLLLGIGAAIFD